MAKRPPDHVLAIANWHPELTNRILRKHWSLERKAKREAALVIDWSAKKQGIPKATNPRRLECVMVGWPKGRLPDADAFDKVLLDGLKTAGIIVDDSPNWLIGRIHYYYYRSSTNGTYIAIWEASKSEIRSANTPPNWWTKGYRAEVDRCAAEGVPGPRRSRG